jgi:hypothetical protein
MGMPVPVIMSASGPARNTTSCMIVLTLMFFGGVTQRVNVLRKCVGVLRDATVLAQLPPGKPGSDRRRDTGWR